MANARSALHFPFHGVRRVLRLFARPLDIVAQTVNRVASHVRAQQDQHECCEDYRAHKCISPFLILNYLTPICGALSVPDQAMTETLCFR